MIVVSRVSTEYNVENALKNEYIFMVIRNQYTRIQVHA